MTPPSNSSSSSSKKKKKSSSKKSQKQASSKKSSMSSGKRKISASDKAAKKGTKKEEVFSSTTAPSTATAVTPTRQLAPTVTLEPGVTLAEYLHAYTESDGTKVVKRITIKRIQPGSPAFAALGLATADSNDIIDPSSLDDFKRAHLARHNELRALHGCPPLLMSTEMCHYAQEWADHLAHHDSHAHRTGRSYGENIYWKMTPSLTVAGQEPVDSWYEEIELYDRAWYALPSPPPGSYKASGHYTQLIWKGTTKLGVGLALNGTTFYVVANYEPHGNFVGRYRENVPPPLAWNLKLPPPVSGNGEESFEEAASG